MGRINSPSLSNRTQQHSVDSVPITETQAPESVSKISNNSELTNNPNKHQEESPDIKVQLSATTPPTRSKSAKSNGRKHRASRTSYRSLGGEESDEDDDHESRKRGSIKRDRQNGRQEMDDSDDEVVRLCHSRGSKLLDPLGRDQPFPAMVNREMLCALVRRSFNQTEEQQIQYDQILRHENGRKSKGEVSGRS